VKQQRQPVDHLIQVPREPLGVFTLYSETDPRCEVAGGRGRDPDVSGVVPTPKESIKDINKGTAKLTWQMTYSQRPQYWYPQACEHGQLGECDVTPGIMNTIPPTGSSASRIESRGVARGCSGTGECSNGQRRAPPPA
jgi:hypothetical protein